MRAVILAAGRGSRMGGLTEERPKCLVELAGRTLLSLQQAALKGGGVTRVAVVRGYRPEAFEGRGVEFFENPRWQASNMVVSLTCARDWLRKAPCLVSYSDIFYSQDIVSRLAFSRRDIAVAYDPNWRKLWERRFADPLSDAETFRLDSQGRIAEIGAKAARIEDIAGQYMGLLWFTPQGWSHVENYLATLPPEAVDKLDMTSLLSRLIKSGVDIWAVPNNQPWGEVDNAADLALYEGMLKAGELKL